VLTLALLLAGFPGCRTEQGPAPTPGPPIWKDLTPAQWRARQTERAAKVLSLRAYAKVKVEAPKRKVSFSEAISVARPASARFDTVGPFGRVISILATDGRTLRFLSPGERRAYLGRPTAENLGRFLPFALRLEDIVEVLLGGVPEPSGAPEVRYLPAEGALEVRSVNRSGSVTLATVDARTLDLRRLRIIDPPPAVAADLTYGPWMPQGGILFPESLAIHVPARDVTMRVRFEKLDPNAAIDPALFVLPSPRGFASIPIESLAPLPEENLTPGLAPDAAPSP